MGPPESDKSKIMALARKLLKWAAVLVGVAFIVLLIWGPEKDKRTPSGSKVEGSRLDPEPEETVRTVYAFVSANKPAEVCVSFTPEAALTFARNSGADTCPAAVARLATQIRDKARYDGLTIPPGSISTSGSRSEISSCTMVIEGGPRLGLFLLTREADGGWIISDHRAEPADCSSS